ncbi:OprD family outer membrane porin [Spongorhabdus nitratireducens]
MFQKILPPPRQLVTDLSRNTHWTERRWWQGILMATLSAMPVCSQATTGHDFNPPSSVFWDQSNINLKFRTDYRTRVDSHKPKQFRNRDFGSALWLQYESGWLNDHFGFDATAYYAKPYTTSANAYGSFWSDKDRHGGDAYDISKIGVANIKLHCGDDDTGLLARFGRMTSDTQLVTSHTSRMTESSFQGGYLEGYSGNLKLYGQRFDRTSARWSSSMDRIRANQKSGKPDYIDYILNLGGQYQFDQGITLGYEWAEGKNYMKKTFTTAAWKIPVNPELDITLDIRHWKQSALGGSSSVYRDPNHESRATNYNLIVNTGSLEAWLACTRIRKGEFEMSWGPDDHEEGWKPMTKGFWQYFNQDNINVWTGGAVYNLQDYGLPGLTTVVLYTHADNYKKSASQRDNPALDVHWERDIWFAYDFQSPSLKGLTFGAGYLLERGAIGDRDGCRVLLEYNYRFK